MIDLGSEVRDRITGVQGVVVSRTQYLTGCARLGVQAKAMKDGRVPEVHYVDEPMLEVLKDATTTKTPSGSGVG